MAKVPIRLYRLFRHADRVATGLVTVIHRLLYNNASRRPSVTFKLGSSAGA